jgi:hypothetical protein
VLIVVSSFTFLSKEAEKASIIPRVYAMAIVRCRLLERAVMRRVMLAVVCVSGVLSSGTGGAQTGDVDTKFVYFRGDDWSLEIRPLRDAYQRWQTKRVATQRLARFPESANTVAWLTEANCTDDALDVVERIINRQPSRIADAFRALSQSLSEFRRDQTHGYWERVNGLVAAARRRIPELEPEAAAALDIVLLSYDVPAPSSAPVTRLSSQDRNEAADRRRAVLERHAGTTAVRLAAVEIAIPGPPFSRQLEELDALADREPGTVVAAKAKYTRASWLAHNDSALVREGADPDPTDRLLEVLAIVRDLESGRYPSSQWVEDAPELVVDSYAYRPKISPRNAERLLDGLHRFVNEHQSLLAAPEGYSVPYVVTKKLPAIAAFLPDGPAVMERLFNEFAREWQDKAAAPYLKAQWLDLRQDSGSEPLALAPRSATHEADVRALLASAAAAGGNSLYARRALAHLAEREFSDPASLAAAHTHFLEYLQRFSSASDAWVIGLRLGQVEQVQGCDADAARRFAAVARSNPNESMARVLALAYAARATEATGNFAAALPFYRDALVTWKPETVDTLQMDLPRPLSAPPPDISDILLMSNPALVSRDEVARRTDELTRSLTMKGGQELERGRWLLRQARSREAVSVLEQVVRRYRQTQAGPDAAGILPRARLEAALTLAETSNPKADLDAALKELDALSSGPFATARGMAGIVAATIRLLQGRTAEADTAMTASLQRWARDGTRGGTPPPAGSLEQAALAVRDAVVLPTNRGSLGSGWNGLESTTAASPFVVAPAVLRVREAGSNAWVNVDVSRQPPGLTNVVFISTDDIASLTRVVSRLGGTRRRQPTAIMEVPNQPIGDAQTIIRWWNRFFPARPGHWAGFEMTTYPAFSSIEFTNAERSRAVVPVTMGYSGADVVLEKVNGVWAITGVVNQWVT